jgi:hypothetical protein
MSSSAPGFDAVFASSSPSSSLSRFKATFLDPVDDFEELVVVVDLES